MTEYEFFNAIKIKQEDIEKAKFYIKFRGLSEHCFVLNYLQTFKNETVTYGEIATALRYDKRIRRILYKFLGLLEEFIRAFILNKYELNEGALPKSKELIIQLNKQFNLYQVLNQLTFGNLISEVKMLPQTDLSELFHSVNYKEKNLNSIVKLRNEVCHNRFLLHNKRLGGVTINGQTSYSLWANIINLINFLPEHVKESFKEEIVNSQKEDRKTNKANQVEWDLISDIVISI